MSKKVTTLLLTTTIILAMVTTLTGLKAEAMTGPRVYHEVSVACRPYVKIGNTAFDVFNCELREFKKPIRWRAGWSSPVQGEFLANFTEGAVNGRINIPTYYGDEEIQLGKIFKTELCTSLEQFIVLLQNNARKTNQTLPITKETIGMFYVK